MPSMFRSGEPLIDDTTPVKGVLLDAGICGTVPRDYGAQPVQTYGAVDFPTMTEAQIKEIANAMAKEERRLSDIYLAAGWKNLDQNGDGYCWQYGPGQAYMILREVQHLPYVRINPHAPAAVFKKGVNEGCWGAQGMQNLMDIGAPAEEFWQPIHSRDYRKLWTPECQANAAKHKIIEGWWDAAAPVYNRDMSWLQVLTLLVSGVPVVCDFDWWGHCVVALDAVIQADGSLGVRILNSWLDWGDHGLAVLSGSKARPNNAVAPRTVTALS